MSQQHAPPPASAQEQQQQQLQQQYAALLQQQQQQYAELMQWQQQQAEAGVSGDASASTLQQAQAQQLQLQQYQWHQLQQLQQLQQQAGVFNPQDSGAQQSAGASQYRSAYQSYGAYPPAGSDQQQLDSSGQPLGGSLPPLDGSAGGTGTGRRTYREQHAPSVDPNAWNNSVAYPSKSNPDRYLSHRSFFSDIPPIVNRLPRKPELKQLVLKGREFYTNHRAPHFYNPVAESGWDNRTAVLKTPITPGPLALGASAFKNDHANNQASMQQQQLHGGGPLALQHASSSGGAGPNGVILPQSLPSVEEAKDQFGHFPVLVSNPASRPGSKLLVPFLHCWPPPFRFDYLKKHSRAPLSPFLASLNGYDVPPELFLTAKQQRELQRAQQQHAEEQMAYAGGAFPPQQGYHDQQQHSQAGRHANPNSSDPIERARARAHTHTTYWRTVPQEGVDPSSSGHPLTGQGHGHSASPPQKSHRPEWNFRHHIPPKQPRVGQTSAKTPQQRSGRGGRTQQQLDAQAHAQHMQQQQAFLHAHMMSGQALPPLFGTGQFPGGPGVDPALMHQWQMQLQMQQHEQQIRYMQAMQQQQQQQAQQEQQHDQEQPQQQQSEHASADQAQSSTSPTAADPASSNSSGAAGTSAQDNQSDSPFAAGSSSSAGARASSSHPPPSDGSTAPGLNPRAQTHIKELHQQLYHGDDKDGAARDEEAKEEQEPAA